MRRNLLPGNKRTSFFRGKGEYRGDTRGMEELIKMEEQASPFRKYPSLMDKAITGMAAVMVVYHVGYVAGVFEWLDIFIDPAVHMAAHLFFLLPLVFLLVPRTKKSSKLKLPFYDVLLIALAALWNGYMIVNFDQLYARSTSGYLSPFENVMVWVNMLVVIEAARRVGGWALPATSIGFMIYLFVGPYMPSFLEIPHFEITRIGRHVGLFVTGMYGSILGISSTLIIMYMLLGEFLTVTGAGEWFIDLANALLGKVRGGSAKVAIMGSSLFGMISASSIVDTATVGVITIPLMKKSGYPAQFAAAVEAAASNGGQIMPPVMGIAAFIMADFLGISYAKVALIALLPGILYYLALFIMVDMEAVRLGLKGLAASEIPRLWPTLKKGWQYILPLFSLIFLLIILLYSPEKSALAAVIMLFLICLFKKDGRIGFKTFSRICRRTAQAMLLIVTMCSVGGIVIGAVSMSGLGYRLSSGLVDLSGGNMFLLALLAAISCLILGLNLPTSVVYLIGAILIAPALTKIGLLPIVAHFFIFFYGVAALITPPVCETAFVAAGIAGSNPMRTGFTAVRLAGTSLFIPFFFLVNPALLLQGSIAQIALAFIMSIIGIIATSLGFSGRFLEEANWFEIACLIIGGLMLIYCQWLFLLGGMAVIAAGVFSQILKRRKRLAQIA
jgi:TRAP transporter 4TM/12TM fusion protein